MTTEAPPALAPVPSRRPVRKARGRLALVLGLLVAAIGLVLYEGLLSSLNYYYTVNEALSKRATIGTTGIRLEGVVVPHTVLETKSGADFAIEGTGGATVDVDNDGLPPQLFEAGIPVVVVGHFSSASSRLFLSNQIMIDHSANYAPQSTSTTVSTTRADR